MHVNKFIRLNNKSRNPSIANICPNKIMTTDTQTDILKIISPFKLCAGEGGGHNETFSRIKLSAYFWR